MTQGSAAGAGMIGFLKVAPGGSVRRKRSSSVIVPVGVVLPMERARAVPSRSWCNVNDWSGNSCTDGEIATGMPKAENRVTEARHFRCGDSVFVENPRQATLCRRLKYKAKTRF